MREFFIMAGVQFVSYLNLTINYRAIAHGQIGAAMVTDAMAGLIAYVIVRRIVKSEGHLAVAGMMVGGSLAAAAGMWLTATWG
jgi:hypothetical protein